MLCHVRAQTWFHVERVLARLGWYAVPRTSRDLRLAYSFMLKYLARSVLASWVGMLCHTYDVEVPWLGWVGMLCQT